MNNSKEIFRKVVRGNVTEIIRKVTSMMGNVMRMLRDEKGFSKEKEIKVQYSALVPVRKLHNIYK